MERNGTTAAPGGTCPVVAAFDRQAADRGERPALVLDHGTVGFAELSARADAVAAALTERAGGRPGAVPLLVRDPAWMLASALGVLRAGGHYVPLNPAHPAARNRELLGRVGARTAVTDQDGPPADPAGVAWVGTGALRPGREGFTALAADPDDWAYVLYTSGSTGRPKGIMQRRSDMWQNVERHRELGVGPEDRVTLINADGFVAAVSNPFTALLNGAALVPHSFQHDGVHDLVPRLDRLGVTVYYSFPSFLRQAATVAAGRAERVRLGYLGGEPVHRDDVLTLRRVFPAATAAIGLNSTETGLTRLTLIPPDRPVPDPVPVGGPVPGVETVVVDEDGGTVPAGVPGGITVRSPHVRPVLLGEDGPVDLTTAVPGRPGVREFRTGDRGRMDATGQLVHLGRGDAMVKVRGYRVEVSEVEAAAAAVPGVSEAAVVPYAADGGETELALYAVPKDRALDAAALRGELAALLPAALVPTAVVLLAEMPRTGNGKVDRGALPAPVAPAAAPAAAQVAPGPAAPVGDAAGADDVEGRIAAVWCEILGLARVAEGEDFFSLGGTSISALRVVSRIRQEFGVPLRLAAIFETPTVRDLAAAVRTGPGAGTGQ
ncbi:AMP-binding protein [Kitasatospora phosalacinea]|uniref:PhsA n=1 Tax=Kitasatospora phosalacinea TaxID=2065 RepID=A0A0M3WNY0_9ACTN|nr:AMP-binding protein [Kitasatospora phosalacinea]AKO69615.1 PhsA [Kitasatospora phosalacinea]